jgi:glycosyltransferase involved in cell wall biosynthesis
LRIAFISPFFPLKGGIARFSELLQGSLCKRGHDVISVPFKALYPGFIAKRVEASLPAYAHLVLYNPLSWPGIIRYIKSLKPDILLVAYWTGLLAPLCFLLRHLTGIRLVVLLHNLSSHESFFFEPVMQRFLAASTDGFITLSDAVSCQVSAVMPDIPQLTLFHPAYQPEGELPLAVEARKELNLDVHSPVLLFFGYVRHYKGLDNMLRAMPAILQREPSLRLVVAGHFHEDVSRYRRLIDKLGISGNVDLYPGYVARERTALFFAAADAVVLPYRSATQSGVVQLAYGHALPVIVTPVGALPEMVRPGETGWIARDSSPEGFADAVGEFLDGRGSLPAMRLTIEAFRREFSWESFANSAGIFLETIAAGR